LMTGPMHLIGKGIHKLADFVNEHTLTAVGFAIFLAWAGAAWLFIGSLFIGPTAPPSDDAGTMQIIGWMLVAVSTIASCIWFYQFEEWFQEHAKEVEAEREKQRHNDHEQALEDRWDLRQRERDAGIEPWPYDDELDEEIIQRQANNNAFGGLRGWMPYSGRGHKQWSPPSEPVYTGTHGLACLCERCERVA
jgi:hypothetical protein